MSVERVREINISRKFQEILGFIVSQPLRTKLSLRLEQVLMFPLKLLEGKEAPEWRKNLPWQEKLLYEGQLLLAPVLISALYLGDKLTSFRNQNPYYSQKDQGYLLSNSVDISVAQNQPCNDPSLHQNN